MSSIEMITSKRKEITVKDEHGRIKTVVVQVWNGKILTCSKPFRKQVIISSF